MGIALALLLVGGSLVLANQALDQGRPGGAEQGGHTPAPVPPAPALLPLEQTLLARASVDLVVELPGGLAPRGDYRLRIYVNGEPAREERLPPEALAKVDDVPLHQGANRITAAIHGPRGESLHSAALQVERDDVAPAIEMTSPQAQRAIYTEQAALRGRSEPLALISVRNVTTGQEQETEADTNGRWEVRLDLALGRNVVTLRSRDRAGNRSRASVRLERVESQASVSLEVRPAELEVADLPATLRLVARVRGLRGEPLDGAAVTFSLSAPGQQTLTYTTTTRDGLASWSDIRVPRDGAREGQSLATVMVLLDDGQGDLLRLQESASIRIR